MEKEMQPTAQEFQQRIEYVAACNAAGQKPIEFWLWFAGNCRQAV